MNKLMMVVFLPLVVFALPATGAQIEIGAGISRYNADRDGLWYQRGNPHTLNLSAYTFQLGITGDATDALMWHLDLVDLGGVSSDAYCTARDSNYNPQTQTNVHPTQNLADFNGHGSVWGAVASIEPHANIGGWIIGAEAGAFLYYATWDENIAHWHAPRHPGEYQDITADHAAHWSLSGVAGVSVGRGNWALQYRYYIDPATGDQFPAIYNHTQTLSLVLRF